MKKLKFSILLAVIVAVGLSVSERSAWACGRTRCDTVSNDTTLCQGTVDVGCDQYCTSTSLGCSGFTDVCGSCSGLNNTCVCRGTPLP